VAGINLMDKLYKGYMTSIGDAITGRGLHKGEPYAFWLVLLGLIGFIGTHYYFKHKKR